MPECRHRPMAFIRGKNKVACNEKWKKQLGMKYGKFWSVSLEHFVEHKLWNYEECKGILSKNFAMFVRVKHMK